MSIFFVVVSLSLLIIIHELGHFLAAKFFGVQVDEFGIGFPPRIYAKRFGQTLYSLNLLLFGGFVKIHGEEDEPSTTDNKKSNFRCQNFWRQSIIILAGIFMNILLGWFLFTAVFMIGLPSHLVIGHVFKDSAAAQTGLVANDIILEAKMGPIQLNDPIKSQELIDLVTLSQGQEISLKISRNEQQEKILIKSQLKTPENQWRLGISLVDSGLPKLGLAESLAKASVRTAELLEMMVVSFGQFFTDLIYKPSAIDSVTGPIGIFQIALGAETIGLVYFLQFLALISLNLAVLNLLPLPVLDGGRFVILLLEKIKGSPISRKTKYVFNAVSFIFLITLMLVVTVQDLQKILT